MTADVEIWLTSVEVRKALRISTCDLAHLREEGGIGFVKKGNAYLYSSTDVERLFKGNTRPRTEFCSLDSGD